MQEETITDTAATPAASPTRPFHRCGSQGSGGISPCSLHRSAALHSKRACSPAPHMHPPRVRARARRQLQPHVYDFKRRVAGGHHNFKGSAFQPEGKDFRRNCHIPATSHTRTALPPTHPTPQEQETEGHRAGQGNGWANRHGCSSRTPFPRGAQKEGWPLLQGSGSHPRLTQRPPQTPPSAWHSQKGTSAPPSLHRLNAPEPQLPRGCTEPGLSLGARVWVVPTARTCSSGGIEMVPLVAKPELPLTASGQAAARPPTLMRLRFRPSPLVRVIKDDKSQEVGEEGKCELEDEELNLPPPGNMTVIYSSQQTTRAQQRNPAENRGGKNPPELFCLPSKLENATLQMIYAAIFSLYSQRIFQASQEHLRAAI